jgi:hypothetical protein
VASTWVEQTFGVAYTYNGMFTLLARLEVHQGAAPPS